MKSGVIGGLLGSLIGILLGAAAFRTTSAVDSRFTYQGQIRNGEALVDGNIDVRFTLWDSLDSGATVGSAVTKTNLPIVDGRFATELDFGSSAFAGDSRWIQMEVRSPAGSGQYLALSPRQMINAVPYALYSLNGGLSPWNLDVASRDIGYTNGRVGIGTNSPTAALEVISATTGNDAVKLPAGSIGVNELAQSMPLVGQEVTFSNCPNTGSKTSSLTINCPNNGYLLVIGSGQAYEGGDVLLDGQSVGPFSQGVCCTGPGSVWSCNKRIAVTSGSHTVAIRVNNCASGSFNAIFFSGSM